jgi:hypothetical protein
MDERIILTIEKLRELCPKCAEKVEKNTLAKGMKVKKVSIRKSDYDWFMLNKNDRPPKEWWDRCIESVGGKAEDPSALCGWVWYHQKEGDEEASIPDTEDSMEAIKEKMKADECIGKLRKDIETVMCWRKFGKPLNKEQQAFANIVADEMIALRVAKQVGIQLVSKNNINFIKKGMQPVYGSDRVGGITQDVVSNVQAQSGKFPRQNANPRTDEDRAKNHFRISDEDWEALPDEKKQEYIGQLPERGTGRGVTKIAKPTSDPSAREKVPASASESGQLPRKTSDIKNGKQNTPEDQKEGEVTDTIGEEKIGHQPNLPIPKKMAEELIANAQWGIEIGAYTNMKEGIESQLGRKVYEEFVDTDDKLKAVIAYLNGLKKE